MFLAFILLPYAMAGGGYFVLFRVANRTRPSIRPLLLYPAIGSALGSAAFLIWAQVQWFSAGPTSKALSLAFTPILLVTLAISGFVACWLLVFLLRCVRWIFSK
jgi:hypothetical protein